MIGHNEILEMLLKRKSTPQNLKLIKEHVNDIPPFLLSSTPSERVLKIREDYYMDLPENVIKKIKYNFHVSINNMNGSEFIIYPFPCRIHSRDRSVLFGSKIVY